MDYYAYVSESICGYIYKNAGTPKDHRYLLTMELELHVILSHLMCVLGNKLWSSASTHKVK